MRSLVLGMSAVVAAAMPFVACAEQKTVPAGTTVTVEGSDISSWASADIDIGAGATLCFSEPTADATFTGKITGSGHFVAKFASNSDRPKVFIMNGDANEFTGAFFYSNVYLHVKSPQAVGNVAPITIRVGYTGPTSLKSQFFGSAAGQPDFVYQNALDVYVQINSSSLAVGERAVLAGSVLHRYGALSGPGKITGGVTTTVDNLYFTGSLHVDGPVTSECSGGTKLSNNNSIFYLGGKTEGLTTFQPIGCYNPVYFDGDNLFGEDVELQMGVGSGGGTGGQSARIDLNGHSQTFKRSYFTAGSAVPAELKNIGGIDNSGSPAAVTFANNDVGTWFYGRLDGHLSVSVAGSALLGFVGPTNTLDGTITSDGCANVTLGYEWPNVRNIVSRNGGLVVFAASANINPKATIEIDGSSKIKVSTGLEMKVRRLRINGVDLPTGTYTRNSPAVNGHFDNTGNGTIQVLGVPGMILSFK